MKRSFLGLLTLFSLLLGLGTCWFWLRGTHAADEVALKYNRYRADGRVAGDSLYLKSERRIWLTVMRGHVGPYDGRLVWGYHVAADLSGGRPQWHYSRYRYPSHSGEFFLDGYRAPEDEAGMAGWGPLRWRDFRRSEQKQDEQFRMITLGVSHWLIAGLFFVLPLWRSYACM